MTSQQHARLGDEVLAGRALPAWHGRYGDRVTDEIEILTADSEPDRLSRFHEATRIGFSLSQSSDEQTEHFVADARADRARLRQVADPEAPGQVPVATLVDLDGSINAGAEILPATLITDVTVRPDHRRRGLMRRLMAQALGEARDRGTPVALLTATEATIYARFGFGVATLVNDVEVTATERFRIHPEALAGHGRVRMVSPDQAVDLIEAAFARFHTVQRGSVVRPHFYRNVLTGRFDWDRNTPVSSLRTVLHHGPDGEVDGWACYVPRTDCFPHRVQVTDLGALSAQAHLGLWDFLGSLDLVGRVTHSGARLDDPLPWALADRRCYRVAGTSDRIWARVLDPVRCLAARPWHRDGTTVLQITDPLGLAAQTLRVEVRAGQVSVTATTDEPQVQIAAAALAGLWLGTASVAQLAGAGQVVGSPAALAAFTELTELADPPYANTFF